MAEPRRVGMVSSKPEHCPRRPCRFHGAVPPGSVYVGRAMPNLAASPYANPWVVGTADVPDAETAVERFRTMALADPAFLIAAARDLAGHDLADWCEVGAPCHGDTLLELIVPLLEDFSLEERHDAAG